MPSIQSDLLRVLTDAGNRVFKEPTLAPLRRAAARSLAAILIAMVLAVAADSLSALHRDSILTGQRYSARFKPPYIVRHRELRVNVTGTASFVHQKHRLPYARRSRTGGYIGAGDAMIDGLLRTVYHWALWAQVIAPALLLFWGWRGVRSARGATSSGDRTVAGYWRTRLVPTSAAAGARESSSAISKPAPEIPVA